MFIHILTSLTLESTYIYIIKRLSLSMTNSYNHSFNINNTFSGVLLHSRATVFHLPNQKNTHTHSPFPFVCVFLDAIASNVAKNFIWLFYRKMKPCTFSDPIIDWVWRNLFVSQSLLGEVRKVGNSSPLALPLPVAFYDTQRGRDLYYFSKLIGGEIIQSSFVGKFRRTIRRLS